jgi:nuclear pore complex protein Nup133
MNAQGIKLAEKYLDFNTLIQICEATSNQDRLEGYITKFFEAVSTQL